MKRVKIVVGNWKCHKTPSESVEFVKELKNRLAGHEGCEVGVGPTFTALYPVGQELKDSNIALCSQNIFWEKQGAFTGEIAPGMLKDCGVKYTIIGHSERRQYFGETDETVNKRLKASFAEGMSAIVCIGETLAQREAGKTNEVLSTQLKGALADISGADMVSRLVIAYEPVWAIGTGKVATTDQVREAHAHIRAVLNELLTPELGETVRIQYGGSVKPENATEIFAVENVDGGLIGGAALKADSFMAIINAAK